MINNSPRADKQEVNSICGIVGLLRLAGENSQAKDRTGFAADLNVIKRSRTMVCAMRQSTLTFLKLFLERIPSIHVDD